VPASRRRTRQRHSPQQGVPFFCQHLEGISPSTWVSRISRPAVSSGAPPRWCKSNLVPFPGKTVQSVPCSPSAGIVWIHRRCIDEQGIEHLHATRITRRTPKTTCLSTGEFRLTLHSAQPSQCPTALGGWEKDLFNGHQRAIWAPGDLGVVFNRAEKQHASHIPERSGPALALTVQPVDKLCLCEDVHVSPLCTRPLRQ